MNEPELISPPLRLKELQAIKESLRTESQWDELNELEISLTFANRKMVPEKSVRRHTAAPTTHPTKPGNGVRQKKPVMKTHKRSPKVNVA